MVSWWVVACCSEQAFSCRRWFVVSVLGRGRGFGPEAIDLFSDSKSGCSSTKFIYVCVCLWTVHYVLYMMVIIIPPIFWWGFAHACNLFTIHIVHLMTLNLFRESYLSNQDKGQGLSVIFFFLNKSYVRFLLSRQVWCCGWSLRKRPQGPIRQQTVTVYRYGSVGWRKPIVEVWEMSKTVLCWRWRDTSCSCSWRSQQLLGISQYVPYK